MKGLQKIKKKIQQDASTHARKERSAAQQEAKRVTTRQKEFQNEYKTKYEDRTAVLAEVLKQKNLAKARLDAKKSVLQKREQIIDNAIENALQHRSASEYKTFLKNMIAEHTPKLDGQVTIHCTKDDATIVKELAPDAMIATEDTLTGGLIFTDEQGKRIDESIEAVLQRKRDTIRQKIVNIMSR